MPEIKWIKITTNIFDDEKMKIIDTMPARDEIIVIWFKLLCLAGKVNENGLLFMSNKIAYTVEMLAAIFNRELNTVKLALQTFEGFGMIDIEDNNIIGISNWEKHQNIDGMDKIREQNRLRQQKHREKKQLSLTSNVTSRDSNALEEDREENKSKKKIKSKESIKTVYDPSVDCDYFLSRDFCEAWEDFILHRKKLKASNSDRGIKTLIEKIKSITTNSDEAVRLINNAICNGWKTVFPERSYSESSQNNKWKEEQNFDF